MKLFVRTALWLAALVLALGALVAAGDRLAPPPADPSAVVTWLQRTDPAVATFALVRLVAIAVVGYLLLSTVVLVAAEASRVRFLVVAARGLTLPCARRVVRHAVGAGLALGIATSTVPVVAGAQTSPTTAVTTEVEPDRPPVLQRVDDDLVLVHLGAAPSAPAPGSTAPPAPATSVAPRRPAPGPMTTLDADPPAPTASPNPTAAPSTTTPAGPDPAPSTPPPTTTATSPPSSNGSTSTPEPSGLPTPDPTDATATTTAPPPPASSDPEPAPATADPAAGHHTIVSGDHLWGVAEHTLAAVWGVDPSPSQTARYLGDLIDRNRSVLAIPGDPDLVFPGQVFALPPVPAR